MNCPSSIKSPRILMTAGGTGGHLMPALQIARALRDKNKEIIIEFIGSGRPLEAELIDPHYKRHTISSAGITRRGVKGLLQFFVRLPGAVIKTWRLLSNYRPDLIIGVGGYVTFVPVTLGWMRGIKTWIHEAEQNPGLANWVLSLYASRVSTAFPDVRLLRRGGVEYTGHPVRKELKDIVDCPDDIARPENLLILGGSQGASALDNVFKKSGNEIKANGLKVWHQCRKTSVPELDAFYKSQEIEARVEPFIHNMVNAYNWAHIIVSRAGAGAVMEVGLANRPAIFVPYPMAQANHQLANASLLQKKGKAQIVEEGEQFQERLWIAIGEFLETEKFREVLKREPLKRSLNAASDIATKCLELVTGKGR